jgi:lipopolysaccharide transport system permease protein
LQNHNNIKVYEPNYILNGGLRVWPEMFRELIESRGIIWRLIVRDITARYKQSILGIFWSFVSPLVMMLVFVWLKSSNILPISDTTMPYAAFVIMGQVIWHIFAYGMTSSANSLVGSSSLLTKINFPKETLLFSSLGQTIFEFLIRIPLLLLVFFWVGFVPKLTILLVPLTIVPLLFMVVGFGFFIALFNAVIRDTRNILGIAVSLGMFVTPVIYPPPESYPLSFLINYLNPVSAFITTARDLASLGYLTDPAAFVSSGTLSFLLFFVGWRMFHLAEPKIAERI